MDRCYPFCLPLLLLAFTAPTLLAQDVALQVTVEGLGEDAGATLTLERGVGGLFDAVIAGIGEETPVSHTFDIDGNDQVDVGDALLFLAEYGSACD